MRRALNYCTNRDGLVTLLNGLAEPAAGVYNKTDPYFGNPKEQYTYDPAKAKALMKEAGYGPDKPVKAKIMISTSGSGQMLPLPMNEFLQQNLKECGFDISFEVVDWGTMLVGLRNPPTAPQALGADAMNISLAHATEFSRFTRFFLSTTSRRTASTGRNWKNTEFDALIDKIEKSSDPEGDRRQYPQGARDNRGRGALDVHRARPQPAGDDQTGQRLHQRAELVPGLHPGRHAIGERPDASAMNLAVGASSGGGAGASGIRPGPAARCASPLTATDVPTTTGAPDNGGEGMRFLGFPVFESLVLWDLTRADKLADIRPGLAESWEQDANDKTKWIFHLRRGVKFHDGTDWNADAAIWNLDRFLQAGLRRNSTRPTRR